MRAHPLPLDVLNAALRFLEVDLGFILSDERSQSQVMCRQFIIGALRTIAHPQPSYPEINAMLGRNKHHSTAVHQYQQWTHWPPRIRHALLLQLEAEIAHPLKSATLGAASPVRRLA